MINGESRERGATTEQLREDIDSGRTGDKIPMNDPAAAPLGTDEEASGTPLDADLVASTRAAEPSRSVRHDRAGGRHSSGRIALAVALVGLIFLAIAVAVSAV